MLTGNEPVSTGNIKALAMSAARTPGAAASTSGAKIEFDGKNKVTKTIPLQTHEAVCGCSVSDDAIVPDAPGMFAVSVSMSASNTVYSSNTANQLLIEIKAGGLSVPLAAGFGADIENIRFEGSVAVPAEGFRIDATIWGGDGHENVYVKINVASLLVTAVRI